MATWYVARFVLGNPDRGRKQILLLVMFFSAIALPLGRFDQPLWRDEASSVWFAHLPLAALLTSLCDPHPPGYYLLLKAWLIGGENEAWLRLPSLLAAVLAVGLTYRLGLAWNNHRSAWLAAMLLALHPLQSWYGAEVRMYLLVQVMGLSLVWLGWRLLSGSRQGNCWWRTALIYWLVVLAALGLDYIALLPFGLLQLLWLARGRPDGWRWLTLQAAALLPAAILWLNASQLWAMQHDFRLLLIATQVARFGFELTLVGATRLLQLILFGLILVAIGLAWLWPRYSPGCLKWRLAPFLWIGVWLILLLLAAIPRGFTIKSHLTVVLPYLALWVGLALSRLPKPVGEYLLSLGLLVTLLVLSSHQREPWRAVVTDLIPTEPDQVALIWVDEQAATAFDYYLDRSSPDADQIQWAPLLGHRLPQLPDLAPLPGETLWIVAADSNYRRLTALLPPDFYRNYQLLEDRHQRGIDLYRYRRRISPLTGQADFTALSHLDRWALHITSPLSLCRSR